VAGNIWQTLRWGGESDIPVADAKLDDITGLLGGGLFIPLFKWMKEAGPVYLLPTGPVTSYVVISDPDCIKQVLFNYGNKYIKVGPEQVLLATSPTRILNPLVCSLMASYDVARAISGRHYMAGTIAEAGEFLFGLGVALQAGHHLCTFSLQLNLSIFQRIQWDDSSGLRDKWLKAPAENMSNMLDNSRGLRDKRLKAPAEKNT